MGVLKRGAGTAVEAGGIVNASSGLGELVSWAPPASRAASDEVCSPRGLMAESEAAPEAESLREWVYVSRAEVAEADPADMLWSLTLS